ncbi:GPW/gp25 family protein [bacterium]|nr:GPW/gp25 family protein [bacterium]
MAIRFTGFSTKNKSAINHILTGKDLIIEDLMNHIMTRKGERVMMPNFGSIVHEMIFEPLTPEIKSIIEEDIRSIIEQEPRVTLDFIKVSDTDHTLTVSVTVSIVNEDEPVTLEIDLERE